MIFRVSDILPEIASSVKGAGLDWRCEPGRSKVLEWLNRATRQLIVEGDWHGMEQEICISINECCLTLDEHFETIRLAKPRGGNPMPIYARNFKYLEPGLGELDCCGSGCLVALEDLGDGFPLHRDPYKPMPIMAYSDRKEAEGACLEIRGTDENGKEVLYGLPIRHSWKNEKPPAFTGPDSEGWSTGNWKTVTEIRKPKTCGYVYLWGYDPATQEYCWLTTIRPETQSPCHRRYKVPGGSENCPQQMIAKVSLRWRPLCRDNDVVLIQNPDALTRMVKSLSALDERDMGSYVALRNSAVSQLKKQIAKRDKGTKGGLNVRIGRTPLGGRGYSHRGGGRSIGSSGVSSGSGGGGGSCETAILAKGEKGDQGLTGCPGKNGKANPRGAYNAQAVYADGDIVTYQGSSYIAIGVPVVGEIPPAGAWSLFAEKGADGMDGAAADKGDPGPPGPPGPQGTAGSDGANGLQGPQGIQGVAGNDSTVPGPAGPAGTNGTNGIDGDQWSDGSTVPVDATVLTYDSYYLRTSNGDVYKKAEGSTTWSIVASIMGPAGATGAAGATGSTGATGATGANGSDGNTVLNGTGAPGSGTGVDGDFYLDTAANDIYGPKTAGAWGSATSLVGPAGPQGIQGAAGATGAQGIQGIQGIQGPAGADGAAGGIAWSVIAATSKTMVANEGYIADAGTLLTFTLPTTAAVGTIMRIAGEGAGGVKIAQLAGDSINFGDQTTTVGTGGSLSSTGIKDAVELICVVADTKWNVISSIGNFTIV